MNYIRIWHDNTARGTSPSWFMFIRYGSSFILFVISTFFLIVRGIEFGDLKTQKWLTSLISGFFSSILLIQPLKVNRFLMMNDRK